MDDILDVYRRQRREDREELGEAPPELKSLAKSVLERAEGYSARMDPGLLNVFPTGSDGTSPARIPYHPYDAAAEILGGAFRTLEEEMEKEGFSDAIASSEGFRTNGRWSVEETVWRANTECDAPLRIDEFPGIDRIAGEYAKTLLHAEISSLIDGRFAKAERRDSCNPVVESYNTLTMCRTKLKGANKDRRSGADRDFSLGNGMSKLFLEFSGKKLHAARLRNGRMRIRATEDRETWSGYALVLQLAYLLFLLEGELDEETFWGTGDFELFRTMVQLDRAKGAGKGDARETSEKLLEQTNAFWRQMGVYGKAVGDALFLPGTEKARHVGANDGQWPMVFREPLAMALRLADIAGSDSVMDLPGACIGVLERTGVWKSNPDGKAKAAERLRADELQLYALTACRGTGRFPARAADGYLERIFGRDAVINPQTGDVLFSRADAASREWPHAVLFEAQRPQQAAFGGLVANPSSGRVLGICGIFDDGGMFAVSSFDEGTITSGNYPQDSIFAYEGRFRLARSRKEAGKPGSRAEMDVDGGTVSAHLYNRKIGLCGKGLPGKPSFWASRGMDEAGKAFAFGWSEEKGGTSSRFLTVLPLSGATDAPFRAEEDAPSHCFEERRTGRKTAWVKVAADSFPVRTGEVSGETIVSVESNCASRSEFTVERTCADALAIRRTGGARDAEIFVLLKREMRNGSAAAPSAKCVVWTFVAPDGAGRLQPCSAGAAEAVGEDGVEIDARADFGVLVWRRKNGFGVKSSIFLFEHEAEAEGVLSDYGKVFGECKKDHDAYERAMNRAERSGLTRQTEKRLEACKEKHERYKAAAEESGLDGKGLDLLVFSVSWLAYVGDERRCAP